MLGHYVLCLLHSSPSEGIRRLPKPLKPSFVISFLLWHCCHFIVDFNYVIMLFQIFVQNFTFALTLLGYVRMHRVPQYVDLLNQI